MINYISKENLEQYKNKTCFLRVDLNFEPDEDHLRIDVLVPTLKLLSDFNIKTIIAGHRGRFEKETPTLEPFADILSNRIGERVKFAGDDYELIQKSSESFYLLENLRKNQGEEVNDEKFAQKLADLADFYVNEAFPVSHRENASISQITRFLPSFGGLHLKKEVEKLSKAFKEVKSPFTLILGGAKTEDKIGVIKNLWNKVDNVLLGGGPANTFLLERGVDIGESIADRDSHELIETFAFTEKVKVPEDFVEDNNMILDIGEKTLDKYSEIISSSEIIIWNGPMGKFEDEKFANGTKRIWESILGNTKGEIIVGGGETISSLGLLGDDINIADNIFLSTGGGAMLEFLSGKELPGIKALENNG